MPEELVKTIKNLLASGVGDQVRLRDILDSIRQGNPVYMSDYKYVQNLLTEEPEGSTEKKGVNPERMELEDPIKLLRIRLAEGKITVEQFRDLKKTIMEI